MKKIAVVFLLLSMLFSSCSLNGSGEGEAVDMNEVMKISAWFLDKELEGKGCCGFITEAEKTYPRKEDGSLFWIPNDGESAVANEDLFVFEPLEVGAQRTMAPMSLHMARDKGKAINYSNLNLVVDYEGIVKVRKIDPADSSIRLRYSLNGIPEEAEGIEINGPCTINICPVGKVLSSIGLDTLITPDTLVGKEYLLEIQGCSLSGKPVVTATVKITAVPDPKYPWKTVHDGQYTELFQHNEERTRFCSIELVSYTYSDMYLLEGEG